MTAYVNARIVAGDDFVGFALRQISDHAGRQSWAGPTLDLLIDTDGDGVPDDVDECIDSDLRPTVVIGDIDTGIANELFPDGCTIQDLVNHAALNARNHGQFVSAIAHLANTLRKEGVLTNAESSALKKAAAKWKPAGNGGVGNGGGNPGGGNPGGGQGKGKGKGKNK